MGDTLQGFFASDFSRLDVPLLTFDFEATSVRSNRVRDIAHFSMPSDKDTVEVYAAQVSNEQGNSETGLSVVVRDVTNSNVIHSETSAVMQTGAPLAKGGSASTEIAAELKNETGSEAAEPSGLIALRLV